MTAEELVSQMRHQENKPPAVDISIDYVDYIDYIDCCNICNEKNCDT